MTPEEIKAVDARIRAMVCFAENCDGKEHRCSICAGMGYICHVSHGSQCPGCCGKGRWPCPTTPPDRSAPGEGNG